MSEAVNDMVAYAKISDSIFQMIAASADPNLKDVSRSFISNKTEEPILFYTALTLTTNQMTVFVRLTNPNALFENLV